MESLPPHQVYRNSMYYLVGVVNDKKVLFEAHHCRTGVYKTINECTPEQWVSGRLFDKD